MLFVFKFQRIGLIGFYSKFQNRGMNTRQLGFMSVIKVMPVHKRRHDKIWSNLNLVYGELGAKQHGFV